MIFHTHTKIQAKIFCINKTKILSLQHIFLTIYPSSPDQFFPFLCAQKASFTVLNYFKLHVACSVARPFQSSSPTLALMHMFMVLCKISCVHAVFYFVSVGLHAQGWSAFETAV